MKLVSKDNPKIFKDYNLGSNKIKMSNGKSLTVEERMKCLEALRKVGDGFDLAYWWPALEQGVQSGLLTRDMVTAATRRYDEVSETAAYERRKREGIICWLPSEVVRGCSYILK
ncbi:MAG: hypothetical protein Q8N63_00845 [Nanoarchaeota archaeon]|nr:hypothetical protein [Nanoarchaeota archaeon]